MSRRSTLAAVIATVSLTAAALPVAGQSSINQELQSAIQKEFRTLGGAVTGACVMGPDGSILVDVNSSTRLVPASNMKLVTTGTALHCLGQDYRFKTGLGYSGSIGADGTLEGDLYIVGGGDPTIGVKDSIALRPDALFWKWKTILKDAGIERIHGRIIGDGRAFEGMLENSSWTYDDTGTYYGTGGNALSFYENAVDLAVSPANEGEPVNVTQQYPDTPWMHFQNRSLTGPRGTGNSLYLFTTDLAPYSELRGTFAVDRRPKTEHAANKYGAMTCAFYFHRNLLSTGWEVTGGYADIDSGGYIRGGDFIPVEKAASEPVPIGSTDSPTLAEIARETNFRSDNFYAEIIFRTIGEVASGIAVYDSCKVAQADVLEGLMADSGYRSRSIMEGACIEDGSGLSRKNSLSPMFLATYLRAMEKSPSFGYFFNTLPSPDSKGSTLIGLLRSQPKDVRTRLRMKSGSMEGVMCYSGYLIPAEGGRPVTFSLMVNNATVPSGTLRSTMDRILTLLVTSL